MNSHSFKIVGGDTDSIMFCKQDMSPFTEKEQEDLIAEINALLPKEIKFANDGMFSRVVYAKAKNYVMVDQKGKRKIKGSAFKSSTLEPILKQLINELVDAIIDDKQEKLTDIYHNYIKMVDNITDIKPWSKKMTLSPTTFKSERKNETKVIDAIKGTEYGSGDKIYVYSKPDDTLQLAEKFDGVYDKETYYEKLYKATQRFQTILPVKELFLNYSLKKNKLLLDSILGNQNIKTAI